MEWATFADRARAIEAASADTEITRQVTDLLAQAGDDLPVVARYVQGRIVPAHDSTKLDIGPALCYDAIAKAAGQNVTGGDVEHRVAEVGDIGDDLLDERLVARHDRLEAVLGETGANAVSPLTLSDNPDEIATIEAEALDAGHEGVMLKDPDSTYSPGRRGKHWLKRKPDVETLDLVVTGAEWGEGRRAELLGTFLLSARTDDGFETLGKVATGITDEELADLTDLLEPRIRSESGTEIDIEPDVVFEVGYEEIQASPTYSSGYALKFPCFLGVRGDKDPSDADSIERVERLADQQ